MELPGITAIGPNGVATYGDGKVFAEFFRGKRFNPSKSQPGAPIYDALDMIRVIIPGERDVMEYEATREYQRKYPQQWAAYQQGLEQRAAGTPLDLMFIDQPEQVAMLNAMRIWTVQQLANISDTAAHNIRGGLEFRRHAVSFLERAKDRTGEIDGLKAQIARLEALITKPTATTIKRGPGRPPKAKSEAMPPAEPSEEAA